MKKLIQSWLLIALGVLIAASTSAGIRYDGLSTLIIVVLLLSMLNVFLKPLLVFFTLPFVIFSMGLGLWLINALLLLLVGQLVPGFEVASYLSAMWGSLVISLVSLITNLLLYGKVSVKTGKGRRRRRDDDVIDI